MSCETLSSFLVMIRIKAPLPSYWSTCPVSGWPGGDQGVTRPNVPVHLFSPAPAQLTQDGDIEGWELGGNLAVIRQTWKCRYQQADESEQRKGSWRESPTSQLTHNQISRTIRICQKTFYARTIGNYIEMQTNLQLKPDNVLCTLLHIFWAILSSSGCLNRTGIYA